MTRHAELEVIPAAQHLGLGVVPWSPLHGGLLAGVLAKMAAGGAARGTTGRSADALAAHRETIEAYEQLCADLGHEPADVALGWLLSRPGVTAPTIGPRTVEQFDRSLGALAVRIDEAVEEQLDALFPPIGSGGPAPEAWAW